MRYKLKISRPLFCVKEIDVAHLSFSLTTAPVELSETKNGNVLVIILNTVLHKLVGALCFLSLYNLMFYT